MWKPFLPSETTCPLEPMRVESTRLPLGRNNGVSKAILRSGVHQRYSRVDPPPRHFGELCMRADSLMSLDRREMNPSRSRSPTTDLSCAGESIAVEVARGGLELRRRQRCHLSRTGTRML
jgi:hypothetical protein